MRIPTPWYRSSRDAWFIQLDRKQVLLARGQANEADAWTEFHRLMHERGRLKSDPETVLFADLAELFLDDVTKRISLGEMKQASYDWYLRFLDDFALCFTGTAMALTPSHVTSWLAKHLAWSPATQRGAIVAVKAVLGWAIKNRHLRENPLVNLKRPDGGRREICASVAELSAITSVTDTAFAAFVLAVREIGARPGEVRTVEARQFDEKAGTWTFAPAECIKRSKRHRVFYLTPPMIVLSKALVELNPIGPMFRNRRGKPWTKNAVVCRMRRLRAKGVIPPGTVAYSFRHGYATDALSKGVTTAEVAQLLGHRDTRMVDEFYGHLDQRAEQMKAAARRAVS